MPPALRPQGTGLTARIFAKIIDFLICIAASYPFWHYEANKLNADAATVVWIPYTALFLIFAGRTPGKMLLKLAVFRVNGEKPGAVWAIVRTLSEAIPFAYIVGLFTKDHRGIHDFIAGTIVSSSQRVATAKIYQIGDSLLCICCSKEYSFDGAAQCPHCGVKIAA